MYVCRNEGMTIACGYMSLQGSPTIRKHLIQSCTFAYDVDARTFIVVILGPASIGLLLCRQ